MKRECTKCHEKKELNLDNFYRSPRNPEGFHTHCRECMRVKQKEHNAKESGKYHWTKMFLG